MEIILRRLEMIADPFVLFCAPLTGRVVSLNKD